ncbi:hypothetical protein [Hydrogenivirga sp. 128-5-R1-1]|uniref:hypothetical protein n=1 Tax=Hydrogenivirga sp. 128-5-R1-1 TaxID=392423 RepID=UPI00015F37D3|nr:hypothetical protein HG1285_02423 [Hydrogenivirga sp. 128-5-R1-1]
MSWGKATNYFTAKVIAKRRYLRPEWINMARRKEGVAKEEVQKDGRIRRWIYIEEADKYLRVVFLPDGETVHNAFFDRNFNKEVT